MAAAGSIVLLTTAGSNDSSTSVSAEEVAYSQCADSATDPIRQEHQEAGVLTWQYDRPSDASTVHFETETSGGVTAKVSESSSKPDRRTWRVECRFRFDSLPGPDGWGIETYISQVAEFPE